MVMLRTHTKLLGLISKCTKLGPGSACVLRVSSSFISTFQSSLTSTNRTQRFQIGYPRCNSLTDKRLLNLPCQSIRSNQTDALIKSKVRGIQSKMLPLSTKKIVRRKKAKDSGLRDQVKCYNLKKPFYLMTEIISIISHHSFPLSHFILIFPCVGNV